MLGGGLNDKNMNKHQIISVLLLTSCVIIKKIIFPCTKAKVALSGLSNPFALSDSKPVSPVALPRAHSVFYELFQLLNVLNGLVEKGKFILDLMWL